MRKVVLVCLVAAVCTVALAGAGSASHSTKIRFSVGIDSAYAPLFIAKNQGIFQKYGLDVELVQFAQGGEGVDAMLAGTIDAGGSGDATVLGKSVRGPLKAFGIFQQSGDYIKLVVRKEINSIRDIRRFGYVPGSLSHYGMFRALDEFNIPRTSVRLVAGGPPEMPALLNRGDIDAFVIWEPWPTRAVDLGSGKILMRTKNFGYTYVLMLIGSANWFNNHQDQAARLVRAVAEASRIAEQRPNVAAADTQREVRIPPEDTLRAVQQIEFGMRDFTESDIRTFNQISDFLAENRIAPRRPDPSEVVVRGFVNQTLIPKATAKADQIIGTIGHDTIAGGGGNDSLFGLSGNDTLLGGADNDILDGGLGNDTLQGGAGSDRLIGAAGVDRMFGGAGNDVVRALDRAKDVVDCGPGRDTVYYNRGDRMRGCERRIRG